MSSARSHIFDTAFYRGLPGWAWMLVALGLAMSLLSPHPFLVAASWLTLAFIVRLTWRQAEPPIPVVGVVMLWVVAVGPAVYFAGILGRPLEQVFGSWGLEVAVWLSLVSVIMVALGIRSGLAKLPNASWTKLMEEARKLDINKLLMGYGLAYAFNFVFGGGQLLGLGGLAQLAIAFTLIRWTFFFLLAITVLAQRRMYGHLFLAIAIELVLGLIGYWGSFQDFFFIFAIAYVGARPNLTFQETGILLIVLGLVVSVGLFWQGVKSDYRTFLTQGERTQNVSVPFSEQAEEMWRLVQTTGTSEIVSATDITVERFSAQTFFFGEVVEYIPEGRPYDGGAGWRAGLEHIFMPRLFFPDKPPLHASEITARYTGRFVSGAEEGTSFAIGYFGESYADYGPYLMFVPVFLVGLGLGLMYRFFIVVAPIKLMGFAFAASFLPARMGSVHDVPQMLGRTITEFVAMAFFLYFFGPMLYRWLQR